MVTVTKIREEMADREAIRACLYRYCRGIDRSDRDLLQSVFWPGARDRHTGFSGTAEGFIEWALPRLAMMEQNVHLIGNVLMQIEPATAKVESYFWSVSVLKGEAPRQVFLCGRYLDVFEKRQDEWRISERVVIHDWFNETPADQDWRLGPFGMTGLLRGGAAPGDESCQRLGSFA